MSEYEVSMQPYGPHVKVWCVSAAAPSCDLQVRVRDVTQPTGWRVAASFNDMASDTAYSDCHDRALAERRKILEGEA